MGWGYSIYLTECAKRRIVRWQPDAGIATVFAESGSDGAFMGLAVDAAGHIVSGDTTAGRLVHMHGGGRGVADAGPSWSGNLAVSTDGGVLWADRTGIFCRQGDRDRLVAGRRYGRHDATDRPVGRSLEAPGNLCALQDGSIVCIERATARLTVISRSGAIRTVVWGGRPPPTAMHLPETLSVRAGERVPMYPSCFAVATDGDLVVGDGYARRVYRVDERTGLIQRVAGLPEDVIPVAMITAPGDMLWVTDAASAQVHGYRWVGRLAVQAVGVSCQTTPLRGDQCGGVSGDALLWSWS